MGPHPHTPWDPTTSLQVGTLDQINDSEDAVDHLTGVPTYLEDGARPDSVPGRTTRLWAVSVLDEAIGDHPCRKFVAHRHCQNVIDRYMAGYFRGSYASVGTNVSMKTLALQARAPPHASRLTLSRSLWNHPLEPSRHG
jgi:hypothetical protein